jgi:hypothetical protein
VCLVKLTGSSEETSMISWSRWSVTGNTGNGYTAGLIDESNEPPSMFPTSGQDKVGECASGVIPFGSVPADDPVTEIGYSNQFGDGATWIP